MNFKMGGEQVILTLARDNRADDIRKIVESGMAPVDYANQIGQTALHIAALHGNVEAIVTLLELGIDPSIQNSRGHTALHFAASAKKNVKEACEALVKGGTDPTIEDAFGTVAFERVDGDEELRRMLGAPDPKLFEYAAKGMVEELKALLDEAPPKTCLMADENKKTLMHLAAAGGHLRVMELLLKNGVDPDNMDGAGSTALHDAVRESQKEAAQMLLVNGASHSVQNMRLNDYTGGDWLSKDKVLDPYDQTPMHIAVEEGNLEIIHLLLAKGCDLNQEDFDGKTPFHIALEENEKEVVDLLLAVGTADLNKGSSSSFHTPLHYLAARGRAPLMKRMIDLGAIVDIENDEGWTALHIAARGSKPDTVTVLLDAGSDAFKANKAGNTPLHLAAVNGRLETCKILKQHNSSLLEATNSEGKKPADVASKAEVKAVLEQD